MLLSLALIKPLIIGIPVTGLAVTGGLFVFYPSALGIDVKNHKKNILYSAFVVEDTSLTSDTSGDSPAEGEKAIQCSIGDDDNKIDCSIKKIELTDSKKWSALSDIKGDTYKKSIGDNFFSTKHVYGIKLGSTEFAKVTFDADSKIKIHDKTSGDVIKGNIKPVVGIPTADSPLKGSTKYFLAQAKEFTDSTENPSTFEVGSKKFKCSFTDNDQSANTCKIYKFATEDSSTSEGESYTDLTMLPPNSSVSTIEQHKHYLIKMNTAIDLSTITTSNTDIYTDIYESNGSSKPNTGITKIKFAKLAPVHFHPSNRTSYAFVFK